MLFALIACVVLLVIGREELGLAMIAGIISILILAGYLIHIFELPPPLFMSLVALLDVYLVIKVFGSDLRVR